MRKTYRHTVTGITAVLDETFVKVFGDAFEEVKDSETRKTTKKNEDSLSSDDSSKEGNK